MPPVIRDAQLDDLPAIVTIYNASIPNRLATADLEPVSIESRRDWFLHHNPGSYPLWVNVIGDEVAAWIALQPFYGRPAYRHTAEVSLYVHPVHQGRGIASELLARMIERAPSLGISTLLSFVFAHNKPSVKLNQKFGFKQWGMLPQIAELDGVERDLLIMGKRVDR